MRSDFFAAFALCVVPAAAVAQAPVAVRIEIGSPTRPALVDVQPGVQVLADFHEEVFFTNGWYWLRRDDGWYRAAWPEGTFVYVDWRTVPIVLVDLPPGRYKRWHQAEAEGEPSRAAPRHARPESPPS